MTTTDIAEILARRHAAAEAISLRTVVYEIRATDRLAALDAAITICPVCDQRVIRPHPHAMEASA